MKEAQMPGLPDRRQIVVSGLFLLLAGFPAQAQQGGPLIVALGASNTEGRGRGRFNGGVNRGEAYPAQLEAMLRASGIRASVRNAGIAGDTTGGMLARLDRAVPKGTKVVILQPGGNDARRGIDEGAAAANVAEIRRRLEARGINVIMLEALGRIGGRENRDPDGMHFNAAGHRAFAEWLLPQVQSALR